MTNLLAGRLQMAMSLAFHILFSVVGIALPLMMIIAEGIWIRKRIPLYLELAKRWAKGSAILFAVGAVSGTVISFELGLLWPAFMAYSGSIIGMPFALEGFAFFLEAIFLGIYIYGWDKLSPKVHWFAGLVVLIAGISSAVFVVSANAWMNVPAGFDTVNGRVTNIRPFEAMWNPAAFTQIIHMIIAAFAAVGFIVAGIHALMLLRGGRRNLFHKKALAIALSVGTVAAIIQPFSGDYLAKQVAANQTVKLASMEGQWETQKGAPLRIGGLPDSRKEVTRFALEIPYGLSILAYGKPDSVVKGLKDFPPENRPYVPIVHVAFQIMVAFGLFMAAVGILYIFLAWRRRGVPLEKWFLILVLIAGPMGMLSVEAGWVVTEVGRQPWVINSFMRTSEAVTPMPWLVISLTIFSAVYLLLAAAIIILLRRLILQSPEIFTESEGGTI